MRVATGNIHGNGIVIACMDFEFIGGSLGSVMGEKFSRVEERRGEKQRVQAIKKE